MNSFSEEYFSSLTILAIVVDLYQFLTFFTLKELLFYFRLKENRDLLVEQMEELKYESEDLYTADSDPETAESNVSVER